MSGAFSRREVVRLGALAGGLAAVPGTAFGMTTDSEARAGLALIDRGLTAAPPLVSALRNRDVPVRAIDSDLTALWVDDLSLRWRKRAAQTPLAGLTTAHALLCLEQLGQRFDMRVVWRQTMPDGAQDDGADWAGAVADVWAGHAVAMASTGLTTTLLPASALLPGRAIAWLMTPRIRKDFTL